MPQIIPTAEPFLFLGDSSKPACLLIHGFTGTPKEMGWMGEYLNQQDYTCLGVRLAGHATHPEYMIRSRYMDWMASVEDGYHLLRSVSDEIFLIGLSTKEAPGNGWFDRSAYLDHISYSENPVRSSAELKKLILTMHAALAKVDVPVLLMHSKDDTYVLPDIVC